MHIEKCYEQMQMLYNGTQNITWYATANADTPSQCIFISRSYYTTLKWKENTQGKERGCLFWQEKEENPTRTPSENANGKFWLCKCRWKIRRWLATGNMVFTKSKPRLKNLVVFYNGVTETVGDENGCHGIYLDLCKSFDAVLHNILVPNWRDMDLTNTALGG